MPAATHPHTALYAAFDRFPSSKGAATHIGHMASALHRHAGDLLLVTPGGAGDAGREQDGSAEHVRIACAAPNFVDRVRLYQSGLARLLDAQAAGLDILHFRDPWSGVPILSHASRAGRRGFTVYEVNGLPSIELPYRHPALSARTLERLRAMERFCMDAADYVITPGETLKANLVRMGAPADKITVIPNGADLIAPAAPPADAPPRYLLYFGALQPWQGVITLLRAFALLADDRDLRLAIISAQPPRSGGALRAAAERLRVAERTLWRHEMPRETLAPWISNALVSVAPLAETARNIEQGCCPLKVLESMAAGVAVAASDLPVTRELIEDGVDGMLVRADRPGELARALRELLDDANLRARLGRSARGRIAKHHTWRAVEARLAAWYREPGIENDRRIGTGGD